MKFKGIDICCPSCHGELVSTAPGLHCLACRRRYPVLAGIPDLRIFPDPYISIDADRKKGLQVAAQFGDLSFAETLDYYYGITDVVPPQHAQRYKRGLMSAEARARTALAQWNALGGSSDVLEIGCGTGPLLVAAAPRVRTIVGIDVAFRWLVVAGKRLSEAGLDVPLLCACAEALPFRPEAFDHVVLDSVIEVVADQGRALRECYRVMRPGGSIFISTPNRYSLGPDPHMGVPAGGLWPRALLTAYARSAGAIPPRRRLLGVRSLVRLTRQAGFTAAHVDLPRLPDDRQFAEGIRWLVSLYNIARQLPVSRHLLFWIGPLLQQVAHKPALPSAAQ